MNEPTSPRPLMGAAKPTITTFTVCLDGETHTVAYDPGKTLLDCMLEAGLDAPFMCQQGQCGSCMSVLRKGQVSMLANHVLSERDLQANYVLACQSIPIGNDPHRVGYG